MARSFKLLISSSVVVAFMASFPFLRAKLKPETIYRKISPSVMTLTIENKAGERFVGSGFIALADDLAITAWHLIADARSVWATFADGQRVKVIGCVDQNPEGDLALIRLEKAMPGRRALLCCRQHPVGARAYVIGSPRGLDFSISDGLISQVRQIDGYQQYQLSCPISPGNSGGPVLNDRGEVIGVTSWRKADAQNVSFAVPAATIARLKVSSPFTPWKHFSEPNSTPIGPGSTIAMSAGVKDESAFGSWDEFKRRLAMSAGKTVTVVVQEARHEEKFQLTVPIGELK
jgi:S1-C subfamily serine protease